MMSIVPEASYQAAPTLDTLNEHLVENMQSWPEIHVCPACASCSLRKFATIRHIRYSHCRACGFTFSNPIPTDEVLSNFYNSSFYANYRHLEENCLEQDRYYSISMYTNMERLASWIGKDKLATILDYGCGTGAFLAFLRDKFSFSNVEGVELSRAGIEIGKRNFSLELVSSKDKLNHKVYDFVLLLEVIEHLPRPDVFLKEISELVKPGGHILITTPAVDNLVSLLYPSFSTHFTGPSHISLFTSEAISHLLSRFGFEIERLETDQSEFKLLQIFGTSLLYKLDFASPRHNGDISDILYTPNVFGRLVGLQPQKQAPAMSIFGKALRGADRLIGRHVWWRVRNVPRNEHLYVLARKDTPA